MLLQKISYVSKFFCFKTYHLLCIRSTFKEFHNTSYCDVSGLMIDGDYLFTKINTTIDRD